MYQKYNLSQFGTVVSLCLREGQEWNIRGLAGQDRDELTEDGGGICSLFLTVYLILTNISTVYHLRL